MSLMDTGAGTSVKGFTLHVLCPSLPSPNRFTFRGLPLSITVADLKARLSESIPSQPAPKSQKLLYLGKILADDSVTLQSLFGSLDSDEVSVHLILPPSPPQPADPTKPTTSASDPYHTITHRHNQSHNHGLPAQQIRYRAPNPLRRDEIAQSLHENARRRLAEIQPRTLPQSQWPRPPHWTSRQQNPHLPSYIPGPSVPVTQTTAPFSSLPNLSVMDLGEGLQLPEEAQPRLRLLRQYIGLAEEQLNCGIVPTIDHVIQLRTHLFKLLDDQLQRPPSERGEYIEPLITRVFDISTRADELRQPRFLSPQNGPSHDSMGQLYLVSSPSGYQALCASTLTAPGAVPTIGTTQTLGTEYSTNGQQPNAQPNADAAVMENVVRQAVLNQRPAADGQFGLGRNLRRLWLFMRLYFFCHMFSQPGSQTRLLYVTLAVIAAILSETSVPRRLYEMIFAPVQRHLEGLVHFAPEPAPQGAEATTNQGVRVQTDREASWTAGAYRNLRRVERSAALFIASLVPGVGERHIEVRNAAEAARNAEIARQGEARRQQEEAAVAESPGEHPLGIDDGAGNSERDSHTNTGAEAPNVPQTAIPQEAH